MGIRVPYDIYIHVCGTDLIRNDAGEYLVLEDNGRTPSGVTMGPCGSASSWIYTAFKRAP